MYVAPIANIHATVVATPATSVIFQGATNNADIFDRRSGWNHNQGMTMTRQQITVNNWLKLTHHWRIARLVFAQESLPGAGGNARLTGRRPFRVTTCRIGARLSVQSALTVRMHAGSVGTWPES